MNKNINFIINSSEITAGTRGASLGPDAILTAARRQEKKLFGSYPVNRIPNMNHLLDGDTPHKFAKRIDGLVEVYKNISKEVGSVLASGNFPLVLAGDHGSAGGTIAGIKTAFPNQRLGVVWIDAHGDIHSPFTTPSGNIHGMPLSTALAEDNIPCKSNDVPQETLTFWEELKNMGGISPKIKPEDLVFVAVRDTEEQEEAVMSRLNIKNFTVDEVRQKGENLVTQEILSQLSACDLIYISFDVDSMDPKFTSHGTGTPVDNGLTPVQAETIMLNLLESGKVACLEMVEVNPCLDEKVNTMAEVAFEILEKIVNKIA